MTISDLVQFSSAHLSPISSPLQTCTKPWRSKVSGKGCLYVLSLVMAAISLGIFAERSSAQVVYFERPIGTTIESGVVSTNSGIGLNVRSGPGLSFPIIGGADDGNFLRLVGSPVFADGYRWQRVSTGGWVASDFVSNTGMVNISIGNNCLRTISACGGDSETVVSRPISVRPIVISAPVAPGPYIAAVPGGAATLNQVRRIVPSAQLDRAREGSFVNAGGFATHDGAQSMTALLRANGFDARVIYGR